MAVHRRRKQASSAVRVGLILAANVAAIVALWSLLRDPALEAGAAGPDLNPLSATAASAPARPAALRGESLSLDRIGGELRAIVDRHRAKAVELSKGRLRDSQVDIALHLRVGDAEFGLDADRALRPASNMKLATTAAALTLLGRDGTLVTPFEAVGELRDGRLNGDLVVRAAGDPLFDEQDGDEGGHTARWFDALFAEFAARGLRSVGGDLVLDEAGFDAPGPVEGWPWPEDRFQEHCALSGGFSVNRGCVTIRVAPGSAGGAAKVSVLPEGHGLPPRFAASTGGERVTLGFDARADGLIVRGNIPARSKPFVGAAPVPDPVALFGAVLRAEFERRGIAIEGKLVRRRNASSGETIAALRTRFVDYLPAIHQESNNAVADQLFLAMAHSVSGDGTRANAQAVVRAAIERLGAGGDGYRQLDGSGLSDQNRISARQLTALIHAVLERGGEDAKLWSESLPLAGESGTLESRMRDGPARGRVRAKTGFIDGTSSLSGLARTRDGREIAFAILVNYPTVAGLNTSVWKPMQDRICEALVGAAP